MLLTRLFYYIRGYLVITIAGPYPERFLNVCSNRHILLWDVFSCSSSVLKCCISMHSFRLLSPIARKTGVHVKIVEKRGFPILLLRLKKRKIFALGLLTSILLLIFINQFIWKLEIVGCKTVSMTYVTEKLAECGLKIGAFRPYIDEKKLQNQMLIQIPELAWLWVDKSGSKVVVQVKERVPVPEIYDPTLYCNLIATKDGVIDSMVIKNGVPMVSLGDTVRKGDILVSGLILSEKGVEPRRLQSEGEVYARVWYEKTKAFSLWNSVKKETGKKETKRILHCFGKHINLFRQSKTKFTDYTEETREYELAPFGHYMGIGLTTITYTEQVCHYEKMNAETTAQKGTLELTDIIDKAAAPNGQQKDLRTNYTIIDEDTIEVTVVAEYLENIAEKIKMT
ncbi:MAG: sporulation protein YqfD [Ruminococcaceae bacterium]|nr:sporulation protein YqfD [Oscillospiraceae bacterium]